MKNTHFITFILLLFTCATSAMGQTLDAPASSGTTPRDSLPESWQLDPAYLQTTPDCDKWWELFKDPCLERLISMAVQNNYDVSAAQHRIEAARQMSRADKAGYYPTLGVSRGARVPRRLPIVSHPLRHLTAQVLSDCRRVGSAPLQSRHIGPRA